MPKTRRRNAPVRSERAVQNWLDINFRETDSIPPLQYLAQEEALHSEECSSEEEDISVKSETISVKSESPSINDAQNFFLPTDYRDFLKKIQPQSNYTFTSNEEFPNIFPQLDDARLPAFADAFQESSPSAFGGAAFGGAAFGGASFGGAAFGGSFLNNINQSRISSSLNQLHISNTAECTCTCNRYDTVTPARFEASAAVHAVNNTHIPVNYYYGNTPAYNLPSFVDQTAQYRRMENQYRRMENTFVNTRQQTVHNQNPQAYFAANVNQAHLLASDNSQNTHNNNNFAFNLGHTNQAPSFTSYNTTSPSSTVTDEDVASNIDNMIGKISINIESPQNSSIGTNTNMNTIQMTSNFEDAGESDEEQSILRIHTDNCQLTWTYPRSLNCIKQERTSKPYSPMNTTRKTNKHNDTMTFPSELRIIKAEIPRNRFDGNNYIVCPVSNSKFQKWCDDIQHINDALNQFVEYCKLYASITTSAETAVDLGRYQLVIKSNSNAPAATGVSTSPQTQEQRTDISAEPDIKVENMEVQNEARLDNTSCEQPQISNVGMIPSVSASTTSPWVPVTLMSSKGKNMSRQHKKLSSRVSGDPTKVSFKKTSDLQAAPEQAKSSSRKRPSGVVTREIKKSK